MAGPLEKKGSNLEVKNNSCGEPEIILSSVAEVGVQIIDLNEPQTD